MAGGLGGSYFTEPTVMPRIKVRWKIRKKITEGVIPTKAAAALAVGSLVYCPVVTAIASVTV